MSLKTTFFLNPTQIPIIAPQTVANYFSAVPHRALYFGGGWLALAGSEPEALAAGLAVTIAAVWLSIRLLPARDPIVIWRLALHLPRFVAGSIRSGLDVARRAFSPALPLNPGWIEVSSDLPDGARAALGGELSLMPGTLARQREWQADRPSA